MTASELEKLGDNFARGYFGNYYLPGIVLNQNVHLMKTIYYYEEALAQDEDNAILWSKLANQVDDDKGLAYVDKALKLEPENLLYQTQKSYFLLRLDLLDEALVYLNKVLSVKPDYQQALILKAQVLREQSDLILQEVKVSSDVEELVLAASENFNLGYAQRGLKYLNEAIKLDPENKKLWTTKYWYLHNAHRFNEAEAIPAEKLSFKHTISLKPFFQTGLFGPVALGMSKQQVIEHFGEPEDIYQLNDGQWEMERDGKACRLLNAINPLWLYGNFEFWFNDEGILYRISLKHVAGWRKSWSYVIRLKPWVFKCVYGWDDSLLLSDFLEALDLYGIAFEDKGFGSFIKNDLDTGKVIVASGVEVLYEKEHGATIVGLVHIEDKKLHPLASGFN